MKTKAKTKHTPGPWTSNRFDDRWHINGQPYATKRGGSVLLAVVELQKSAVFADSDQGRTEANARLIAAAPEMLAALIDLVSRCDGPEGVLADGSNLQTIEAHAIIAEATGDE